MFILNSNDATQDQSHFETLLGFARKPGVVSHSTATFITCLTYRASGLQLYNIDTTVRDLAAMSRMADAPPRPAPNPYQRFEEPPSPYSRHPQYRNYDQESMERNNGHSMSREPSSRGSSTSRSPSPRHRSRHRRRRRRYSDYSRSPSPRRRSRRYSSDDSRSPSPRRSRRGSSRGGSRGSSTIDEEEPMEKIEKPWYKKKSVWATVASVASVAALVPTSFAARASNKAANASTMAAQGSIRSANAVERSTNAVINTARGSGHQDHRGRYIGDKKKEEEEEEESEPEPKRRRSHGYDRRNRGGACRHERPLLEYEPLRRALASGDYAMGYSRA
ncbi:hypothetical protein AC578_6587 [Pseudocercospora eumusae]|uniref:Uncharacterized protein n=1 Tax=Pseudocercospora eumusae TaxID=321146 RepID=A0A139GVZ5_9PEZI|nr:hypothetical protein AC578_6587 [Pseudocercospora eumusae]